MQLNNRNSKVELLRFILMFGICVWHLLVHGYDIKDIGASGGGQLLYSQILIMCFMAPGVNCFMFISGYYGIRLKGKKVLSMFMQALFFFVIVYVIRQFQVCPDIFGPSLGLSYLLLNPLPIASSPWWFLTWYFVIMLLSPIIEIGISSITRKQYLYILISLLIINCFGGFLNGRTNGSDLFGLLSIYLVGRFFNLYDLNIRRQYLSLIYLGSIALLFGIVSSLHYLSHDALAWIMFRYSNPLIIIASISLFLLVHSLGASTNRLFNFLGRHCFAIYLVTEFTDKVIYKSWQGICDSYGIAFSMISILVTCLLIVMIDYLREKICRPVEELCYTKMKNFN